MSRARLRRGRGLTIDPELDLTPMVDVVFLLIIFFLLKKKKKAKTEEGADAKGAATKGAAKPAAKGGKK